jgi:hypothetical protein
VITPYWLEGQQRHHWHWIESGDGLFVAGDLEAETLEGLKSGWHEPLAALGSSWVRGPMNSRWITKFTGTLGPDTYLRYYLEREYGLRWVFVTGSRQGSGSTPEEALRDAKQACAHVLLRNLESYQALLRVEHG